MLLDCFWTALGAFMSALWAQLDSLGRLWGVAWVELGASWAPLGPNLAPLGSSWAQLGRSWAQLGASWEPLGLHLALPTGLQAQLEIHWALPTRLQMPIGFHLALPTGLPAPPGFHLASKHLAVPQSCRNVSHCQQSSFRTSCVLPEGLPSAILQLYSPRAAKCNSRSLSTKLLVAGWRHMQH